MKRILRYYPFVIIMLLLACAAVFAAAVVLGPDGIDTAARVLGGCGDEADRHILWSLRLPRAMLAAAVGAALAVCGVVFQTVLGNPLAEPYVLGISSGASAGVAAAVLAGGSLLVRNAGAFAGGLCALAAALFFGRGRGREGLMLTGVMLGAFWGAVLVFLLSLESDAQLGAIFLWMMGSLGAAGQAEALIAMAVLVPGAGVLACWGHRLDLLQLGRDTAESLGLPVKTLCIGLLSGASFLVSVSAALVGPIGFVGLAVPLLLRLLLGGSCRRLLPAALPAGALFLLLCDLMARLLPVSGELPSGVMTAVIGAPLFIMMLRRMR